MSDKNWEGTIPRNTFLKQKNNALFFSGGEKDGKRFQPVSTKYFVSVSVISLSPWLRLITLTSTLIILNIRNTSSNNCLLFATNLGCVLRFLHFILILDFLWARFLRDCGSDNSSSAVVGT